MHFKQWNFYDLDFISPISLSLQFTIEKETDEISQKIHNEYRNRLDKYLNDEYWRSMVVNKSIAFDDTVNCYVKEMNNALNEVENKYYAYASLVELKLMHLNVRTECTVWNPKKTMRWKFDWLTICFCFWLYSIRICIGLTMTLMKSSKR